MSLALSTLLPKSVDIARTPYLKYDALGRRVEKHVVSGAVTTRYVLDGQDIVEEFDGNNTWVARYFHEDRIDHPRAMDRADISDVDGDSNTSEILRFHYHQNALGCVSEITAPGGGVVEWVTYDVYGKATVLNSAGTTQGSSYVGNPLLFTGREFDAESGKYHYRARAYDAEAGRFLQRDPLGYVDGLGLYEYVQGAPSSLIDPSGRTTVRIPYSAPKNATKRQHKEAAHAAIKKYESENKEAVPQGVKDKVDEKIGEPLDANEDGKIDEKDGGAITGGWTIWGLVVDMVDGRLDGKVWKCRYRARIVWRYMIVWEEGGESLDKHEQDHVAEEDKAIDEWNDAEAKAK